MSANGTKVAEAVKDTIYRSCLLLDDEKWDGFLSLCDEAFKYTIKAYSPKDIKASGLCTPSTARIPTMARATRVGV